MDRRARQDGIAFHGLALVSALLTVSAVSLAHGVLTTRHVTAQLAGDGPCAVDQGSWNGRPTTSPFGRVDGDDAGHATVLALLGECPWPAAPRAYPSLTGPDGVEPVEWGAKPSGPWALVDDAHEPSPDLHPVAWQPSDPVARQLDWNVVGGPLLHELTHPGREVAQIAELATEDPTGPARPATTGSHGDR